MGDGRASLSRRLFLRGGFLRVLDEATHGAGRAERPPAPQGVGSAPRTHVARVLPTACIAYRGTLCVTCVERCPLPGAIELKQGRPLIDSSVCDGCGECIDVCPAPHTALVRVAAPVPDGRAIDSTRPV